MTHARQAGPASRSHDGALRPPPPTTIPASADELTAEWVTAALRARGVLAEGRVRQVRREMLGEGAGFIGQLIRLHLQLDPPEPGAPATLIAKLPTSLAQNRAIGERLGAYEREIHFYEELAGDVLLRTPRCYYSAMDPGPWAGREEQALRRIQRIPTPFLRVLLPLSRWSAARRNRLYVLLLEDLAPARSGDQIAGCTPAQAEPILRELARMQARLWDSPKLAPLFWLARTDAVPRVYHLLFRQNRRRFLDEFAGRLPDSIERVAAWLHANAHGLMARLASPPVTLQHGDYRLDNLLFGAPGSEAGLAAVDWQGAGCGRGPLDVAYFLMTNLQSDGAPRCERPLVRAYHDELVARGVGSYSFEACWRDYRLSKLFLVYRVMMGGDAIDFSHERGQLLVERILERLFALLPTELDDLS